MTAAEAIAAGQRDQLTAAPWQQFETRDLKEAYAFGRRIANGVIMAMEIKR